MLLHVLMQYNNCGDLMPKSFPNRGFLVTHNASRNIEYNAVFSLPIMGGNCVKSPAKIMLYSPKGTSVLIAA